MNVFIDNHPSAELLIKAANFYSFILFEPEVAANISIDIEFDSNLEENGICSPVTEDVPEGEQEYLIFINEESGASPFLILAHEMVHVKQYALGELTQTLAHNRMEDTSAIKRWLGNLWFPNLREHAYYDSPWEREAFGREWGLYQRWLEHRDGLLLR